MLPPAPSCSQVWFSGYDAVNHNLEETIVDAGLEGNNVEVHGIEDVESFEDCKNSVGGNGDTKDVKDMMHINICQLHDTYNV